MREAFLQSLRRVRSPKTVKDYDRAVQTFERFLASKGLRLEALPGTVLADYANWATRRWQPSGVHLRVTVARQYLDYVRSRGVVVPEQLRPRLPRIRVHLPTVLRDERLAEFDRHLQALDEPYRTAIRVLAATGVRVGELVNLQRRDIEVADRRVWIHIRGEAGAGNAKSTKDRRVPLLRSAVPYFQHYLAEVRPGLAKGPYVFPRRDGRPLSVRRVQERLQAIGRAMGVRLHPHALRHTYLTLLAEHDVDPFTLQELAGHESIKTTMRYVHLSSQRVVKGVSKLDALFESKEINS